MTCRCGDMQGGIALVHVVQDLVEKVLFGGLPGCAMSSALSCQQRRSIKQSDGSRAVTGDDRFHEIPETVNLAVARLQILSPQDWANHGEARTARLAHLTLGTCLVLAHFFRRRHLPARKLLGANCRILSPSVHHNPRLWLWRAAAKCLPHKDFRSLLESGDLLECNKPLRHRHF